MFDRSHLVFRYYETKIFVQLDLDGAMVCYEQALKVDPHAGWLLDAYGSLLADLGRHVFFFANHGKALGTCIECMQSAWGGPQI